MEALLLVGLTASAFVAMARGWLRQEVAMPLVALLALAVTPPGEAGHALGEAFGSFGRIAVLFTAVAVPAHALEQSGALTWVGLLVGQLVGIAMGRLRLSPRVAVSGICLLMTYVMAGLFHNTTSILVCARVITTICESYGVRALPVLSGALIASNLGGFSTRWGDTPNIKEAELWGLSHRDFFGEILPVNVGALLLVWVAVVIWLRRNRGVTMAPTDTFVTTYMVSRFQRSRLLTPIDGRGLVAGLLGMGAAVLAPMLAPQFELGLSGLAIVFTTLAVRSEHQRDTLLALGVETYATLCGILVLAHVMAGTSIGIGEALRGALAASGMSIWAVVLVSYVGTALTEAASWVMAAGPMIHAAAPDRAVAWALGAGICAGSSSLVTAASAGIILTRETEANKPDARVTFGSYIWFGLSVSLLMLCFYIVVLSVIWAR